MTTMDETKINAEMTVEPQVEETIEETPAKKKTPWKEVVMGSTAGIVLGLAGAGVYTAMAKEPEIIEDDPNDVDVKKDADIPEIGPNVKVASSVNDEMSFSEAFAAARHEVGAGGVFTWHGQVYGTYYKTEWDAMTDEQKAEYWSAVRGTDIVAEPKPEPDPIEELNDRVDEIEGRVEKLEEEGSEDDDTIEPELVASGEAEDGTYAELYDTTGDGQGDTAIIDVDGDGEPDVQIVDVDGDGVADIMAADANGDGVVDESEIYLINQDGVTGMEDVDYSGANDLSDPTYNI